MTRFGPPVVHSCRTDHSMSEDRVIHLVYSPRHSGSTPTSDLRDRGYEIVTVAPFPEEVPGCPDVDSYSGCEQILVRESETAKYEATRPTTK